MYPDHKILIKRGSLDGNNAAERRRMESRPTLFHRMLPGLVLIILAPLVAEVLPGATRMRSISVFPIEIGVWGVGALLIREVVRKWNLGWRNMLLLALALAMAEEFLI